MYHWCKIEALYWTDASTREALGVESLRGKYFISEVAVGLVVEVSVNVAVLLMCILSTYT